MLIMLSNNLVFKIFVFIAFCSDFGVWSSDSANNVAFQFPDYDYKETAKNVSDELFQ